MSIPQVAALAQAPRVRLASLPTPLDYAERLSSELGTEVFVKRDDLTGLGLGGNKARMLEYVLGHVVASGFDTVLVGAELPSNYCQQMAAGCARLGLECHLVLGHTGDRVDGAWRPTLVPLFPTLAATSATACDWHDIAAAMDDIAARCQKAGRHVYRAQIPVGGGLLTDDLERYALGYVTAAFELHAQLADESAEIDEVWICSSEATQAGLVVGNLLLDSPWRIVGVSPGVLAGDPSWRPSADIAEIATRTLALLGSSAVVSAADVESIAGPGGDAYGRLDRATLAAVHRLAKLEGLALDPVYTGKAMAALLASVAARDRGSGRGIVFVHTGGTQLLFAYGQEIQSFLGAGDEAGGASPP